MKRIAFLLCVITFGAVAPASSNTNSRSDTIDVLNYAIHLDIIDFVGNTIKGHCAIQFTPKMNSTGHLNLDLLELTVDSVKLNNVIVSYAYNDTLLRADFPSTMNLGDTGIITVYYGGTPQIDATGWGGFYFQSGYAYNLGVGFGADPHNYGRVWFPCFDNFVERSTYDFLITTELGKSAVCNGILVNETTDVSTKTRHWKMENEIPSYLACVAVAAYAPVNQKFIGINDTIPVLLNALSADTNNVKNSFIHLQNAFNTFENKYGPYRWNKIGYSFVPFNQGAMEHATNITYPKSLAAGTTAYETTMAHELSHHWWGDLVTCETAEEMWINEGMAVYSEFLFTENLYGTAAYKNAVRANHKKIIWLTHQKEGGYRAVSGIPHEYTYGEHVYKKGADVAHVLRSYMGDSLFFAGLKAFLDNFSFSDVNSVKLRDFLSSSSGINLNDFFDNWIFNGGFPHFSVDSFKVQPVSGNYDVTVYVKQKLTGAPNYFNNVPVEITFMDANWQKRVSTFTMSGPMNSFTFSMPDAPVFVALNMDDKISEAITGDARIFKTTGTTSLPHSNTTITVAQVTDSAFLWVEHNWTAPDAIKDLSKKYRISPNRYWKFDGIFPPGFSATARLNYDGTTPASFSGGYLDNELITATEDSLILLYRKNADQDWEEYEYYTKNILTNPNNKTGFITIDSLVRGEYAFAMKDSVSIGINKINKKEEVKIYPNPANDTVEIIWKGGGKGIRKIRLLDLNGKLVQEWELDPALDLKSKKIDVSFISEGMYLLEITGSQLYIRNKLVIVHP